MLRKYALPLFAAALFIMTGYSLLGTPERELVCDYTLFSAGCEEAVCTVPIILKIGNTGVADLERVAVHLPAGWMISSLMKPKVRRFGVSHVDYEQETESVISFGPLESTKWVQVQLFISTRDPATLERPSCQSLLKAPDTKILQGSPEFLRFGRFLYQTIALFLL